MLDKDRANLLAILDSCSKIERFVASISDADKFYSDDKTFDAVLMNFVVIGEAVGRLSDQTKGKSAYIPWAKIKGMRNIVAHEYFGVDAEEVWQTIKDELPLLARDIQTILNQSD